MANFHSGGKQYSHVHSSQTVLLYLTSAPSSGPISCGAGAQGLTTQAIWGL